MRRCHVQSRLGGHTTDTDAAFIIIIIIYLLRININQSVYLKNSRLPVRQKSIELAPDGDIHTNKPQL